MASKVGQYLLFETIGTGAFGRVKVGVHEETGEQVAVKILEKSAIQKNSLTLQVRREVAIMKALRHPNIVNLHQVLTSATKVYMVMDLVRGGELFEKIASRGEGGLPEDEARHYFHQLVDGVHYCHRRGVYHRDLKPENLLVSEEGELKVTDFGLSTIRSGDEMSDTLQTQCGTPSYVAPEVIGKGVKGYSGQKMDTWACGIILYALLTGYLPFDGDDIQELFYHIQRSEVEYPSWISAPAKDLIRRMLFKRPDKRYNLKDVKEHPWFLVGYTPDVSPDGESRRVSTSSTDTNPMRPGSQESLSGLRPELGVPAGTNSSAVPDVNQSESRDERHESHSNISSRSSSQSDVHAEREGVRSSTVPAAVRKASSIFAALPKGFSTLQPSDGSSESLPPGRIESQSSSPIRGSTNGMPRNRSRSDRSASLHEEDMSDEEEDNEDEANLPQEDMNVAKSIRRVQTLVVASGRQMEDRRMTAPAFSRNVKQSTHFEQLAELLQPAKAVEADPARETEREHTIVALRIIERRIEDLRPHDIGVSGNELDTVRRLLNAWLSRLGALNAQNGVVVREADMSVFRRVLAKLDSQVMGENGARDLEADILDEPPPEPHARPPKPTLRRDRSIDEELYRSLLEIMRQRRTNNGSVGVPLYMRKRPQNARIGKISSSHSVDEAHAAYTSRSKVSSGMNGLQQVVEVCNVGTTQTFHGTHFESGYPVEKCLNELGKTLLRMGYSVVRKRGENKLKCYAKKKVPVAVEMVGTEKNTSIVVFKKCKPERGKPSINATDLYQMFNAAVLNFRNSGEGAVL